MHCHDHRITRGLHIGIREEGTTDLFETDDIDEAIRLANGRTHRNLPGILVA